jgi:putative ABC transport system ATP-binding protein
MPALFAGVGRGGASSVASDGKGGADGDMWRAGDPSLTPEKRIMVVQNVFEPMVRVCDVVKNYPVGEDQITVLKGISFSVEQGEFVSIVGPSGNGKSTLLNMITGIDRPSGGEVIVAGQEVTRMSEDNLARWRGENVGIIFQFFQMLPALTLLNNVVLPMELAGRYPPKERRARAMGLLEMVGLADQAHKLPGSVSGGQQQRAAIARALANDPPLLVADEPTGNLDSASARSVFGLFRDLVKRGKTIVMVTHDKELAGQVPREIEILDGQITRDECNPQW